jgi:hypothetical protein
MRVRAAAADHRVELVDPGQLAALAVRRVAAQEGLGQRHDLRRATPGKALPGQAPHHPTFHDGQRALPVPRHVGQQALESRRGREWPSAGEAPQLRQVTKAVDQTAGARWPREAASRCRPSRAANSSQTAWLVAQNASLTASSSRRKTPSALSSCGGMGKASPAIQRRHCHDGPDFTPVRRRRGFPRPQARA